MILEAKSLPKITEQDLLYMVENKEAEQ